MKPLHFVPRFALSINLFLFMSTKMKGRDELEGYTLPAGSSSGIDCLDMYFDMPIGVMRKIEEAPGVSIKYPCAMSWSIIFPSCVWVY